MDVAYDGGLELVKKPGCYDDMLPAVRRDWDAHDKTCKSLPYFWLGRKGGVTAPGDVGGCDGCGVTFFWEGLSWSNYPDEDTVYLCECCVRKAVA